MAAERMTCTRAEPHHDGRTRLEFTGENGTTVRVLTPASVPSVKEGLEFEIHLYALAPKPVGPALHGSEIPVPVVQAALSGTVTPPEA